MVKKCSTLLFCNGVCMTAKHTALGVAYAPAVSNHCLFVQIFVQRIQEVETCHIIYSAGVGRPLAL